ncbi:MULTISPECIES: ribonuclease HII [Thiomicrorhabdus]|uniref:Ribonuclease HII n=1 Tax=Thiomicrorhabdus heinhorstiae TaxID=2748010 RepID=A0ABS0BVH8_9GAMM|nr:MULTISPECIES: ribonuclease HII [Thiomicrorhabdus]MBF6056826.1 ribonuclease HII [Thiomicrorhabdus heinhorstiae]
MERQISLFDLDSQNPYPCLDGLTIGVDEVGRGPLVGDVVASAVILPAGCDLPLRDSKKLSEKKRELLAEQIKQQAIAYSIEVATPEEIDQLNILHASMLAMKRAIERLTSKHVFNYLYVDGNRCPDVAFQCRAIVKGDDKIPEISAASILAKVYRDRQMLEMHERYPHYGFDRHKGYPTPQHLQAIRDHGLLADYRRSFKPVKALLSDEAE